MKMALTRIGKEKIRQLTPITEGGEGYIYEFGNDILKIYKPCVDIAAKEKKVAMLIDKPLPKEAIKPITAVYDNNNKFTPPSFPYMYFKQIGGDGALSTLSNTEDGINLGLEVKFYSNKSASEVRKLANSAREYMVGIGFHCDYFSPVENVSDTSISQFLTRFSKLET